MALVTRLACGLAALCFAGSLLLMAATDVLGIVGRSGPMGSGPMLSPDQQAAVEAITGWLVLAGCVAALPVLFATVFGRTADAAFGRSSLSVFPGALVSLLAIAAGLVLLAAHAGPWPAVDIALQRVEDLGTPVIGTILLVAGIAAVLVGGRGTGVAAALAAPSLLVAATAGFRDISIGMSTAAALLPIGILAAVLLAAALLSGGRGRLAWPAGCGALALFALPLVTGSFTPRESLAAALVPAIIVGAAIHAEGGRPALWRGVQSLALEVAGVALASLAVGLLSFALQVDGSTEAVVARLPDTAAPMLAIALGGCFVAAGLFTPLAALVITLPLAAGLARAGFAPEFTVVALTIAGLMAMIARTTAWRSGHPPPGNTAHFSRAGGIVALAGGALLLAAIIALPALVLDYPASLR